MKEAFTPPPGSRERVHTKTTTDKIEMRLLEMLFKLPVLANPVGNYVPVVTVGKLLYLSGQLPMKDGSLGAFQGRLGREISVEAGQKAAKQCTLNALAHLKRELGSLDKVKRVVKLTGFVAGMPGFSQQAQVLNGASDFLVELYEESGKHARSAIGVTDLPLGACVEIEYIFEMK